jgi:hypothetical protein
MAVIKEWECLDHGFFESTHPICWALGCESQRVRRVFNTAPSIGSPELKRFHAGLKKSADMMGITNFRSAREGEAAYGNSGKGLLWGDDVQKVLGVNMDQLRAAAATPLTVTKKDGSQERVEKSVMRELAAEGMTKRVLPRPAELIQAKSDK